MGSKRFDGILFTAKVGDHDPMHFHAAIGGGKLIVEIQGGVAVVAARDDARKNITQSEVRKVIKVASREREALKQLWKEAHK